MAAVQSSNWQPSTVSHRQNWNEKVLRQETGGLSGDDCKSLQLCYLLKARPASPAFGVFDFAASVWTIVFNAAS